MTHSPEMIEDEIERTRQRIDARLNRLGDQLNPVNVVGGALGSRSNDPGELIDAAISKARENPVGAALIGAGLASLFTGKPSLPNSISTPDAEELKMKARVKKAQFSSTIDEVKSAVAAKSEQAADTVRRAPTLAKGKAEGAKDWVVENPIAAGLFAVAAGAAISSFFASRSTTSRLEASKELHEAAEGAPTKTKTKASPIRKPAAAKTSTKKASSTKSKTPRSSRAKRKTTEAIQRSTAVLGASPKGAEL